MARILVAEDEADMAMGLRDNLEFEGYEVVVVGDGEAALRAVTEHNPDLLLLNEPLPAFRENPGEFWGIVNELKRMGKGILLTTSDPDAIGEDVDRIDVLYGGVILDSGSPLEVIGRVREAGWPPPRRMYGGFAVNEGRDIE